MRILFLVVWFVMLLLITCAVVGLYRVNHLDHLVNNTSWTLKSFLGDQNKNK